VPFKDLLERTLHFSRAVILFALRLPRTPPTAHIAAQLVDAGTAIGANYRSARRSRSTAEFIARLGVVVEESDETVYWLTVIKDSRLAEGKDLDDLLQEAAELLAIFAASQRTAKQRRK